MSDGPPPPTPPGAPGPGWWLASDGQWYPPHTAPGAQPVQQPVPPKKSSNRGCLIVLAVVGVLMALGVVVAAWVVYKVADTVDKVTDGITVGEVECPSAEDVSDIVGHPVDLAMSGNLLVASGCTYPSAHGEGGAGVSIVRGSGLIADEVLGELESTAQANGAEADSIDVGDGGKAFGSPTRSQAATRSGGSVVEVEIFSEGTEPIGDKKDEAVELLEIFLDLN